MDSTYIEYIVCDTLLGDSLGQYPRILNDLNKEEMEDIKWLVSTGEASFDDYQLTMSDNFFICFPDLRVKYTGMNQTLRDIFPT